MTLKKIDEDEYLTDDQLREYLLAWLLMIGRDWGNSDKVYFTVDEAFADDDEELWRESLRRKYLDEKWVQLEPNSGEYHWRLSAKGLKFINKVHDVARS